MKSSFMLLFLILISCTKKVGENKTDLSKQNILITDHDFETGWNRILLKKPEKWGFIDKEGKIKIPFIYDFINPFENGIAYTKNKGKEFYINKQNQIVIAANYEEIGLFSEGLALVRKSKKSGFINQNGNVIIPLQFDVAESFEKNGLAKVAIAGKYGFIDKTKVEIIPLIYEKVESATLGNIVIARKNYKWAFFNNKGKQLSDFLYTDIQEAYNNQGSSFFKNGPVSVKQNGKYFFLAENFENAFPSLKFDSATAFDSNGNSMVRNNGKFGILKNNGKMIIPVQNDIIEIFNSNGSSDIQFYRYKKGSIYGIINRDLKIIAESRESIYDGTYLDNINYISFKNLQGKYGLVDKEGIVKVPFMYYDKLNFSTKNFSIAKKGAYYGIIDINNKILIPIEYTIMDRLDLDDFDLFKVSGKNGEAIINLKGKILIDGYQTIDSIFLEPLKFIVQRDGKFGIIDINKKIVLPLEYDKISNWTEYGPQHSKFIVKNGKTGLIDEKTFKITIPPIYDKFRYTFGVIFVKKNNRAGIINEDGKIICNFIYDDIYPNFGDLYGYTKETPRIYARKGKLYFQIDEKGKVLKSNLTEQFVKENSSVPIIIKENSESSGSKKTDK